MMKMIRFTRGWNHHSSVNHRALISLISDAADRSLAERHPEVLSRFEGGYSRQKDRGEEMGPCRTSVPPPE